MTRVTLECEYIVVMGADITELKNTPKALEESKYPEQNGITNHYRWYSLI